MNLKTIAVIACLAAAPVDAFAQGSFTEVMEVRITNVDVVVTGKDGKPVSGLKQEDFELYEDGVKKELTNFLEIRDDARSATLTQVPASPETPAADSESDDVRRRNIVVFVDNVAVHPFHRNNILPFVQKFLEENVRKGDEVALITWGNSLKAELEPTSDMAAVTASLARMAQQSSTRRSDWVQFEEEVGFVIRAYEARGEKPGWQEGISIARAYATNISQQIKQRIAALKSVAASMRGTPGRKILVYVTESLSSNPAESAFAFLDGIQEHFGGVDGPAVRHAKDFEITGLVRDVADIANESGVTIYPIDAAGKDAGAEVFDASQTKIASTTSIPVTETASLTMNGIAAETGGVALYGSTNFKLAFDTISNDLSTFYSLGYHSTGEKPDELRAIVVKLKKGGPRYTVRTRQAVIEPSAASEMNDGVSAHLFRAIATNDLAIRATAGTPAAGVAPAIVIPLSVTIPIEKLTLLPDGAEVVANFTVFAAFLGKGGEVSKVASHPQSVRFPADSMSRRKDLTVKLDVMADTQIGAISVGVIDEASHVTGFAAIKLSE